MINMIVGGSPIPGWGDVYKIPFEAMQELQAPVLNIGPYGKNAHQLTEWLEKNSAFIQLPIVLRKVIKHLLVNTTPV